MIQQTSPPKTMRHVGNALVAVMFVSIGAVSLVSSVYLDAAIWFSLGLALLVLGSEATPWANIALWRRVLGVALGLIGVALLAARLWLDFTT